LYQQCFHTRTYTKTPAPATYCATSWKEIDERRFCKAKVDSTRSERLKAVYREEYQGKDKEVKKQLSRERNWIDQIASDGENAAKTGNMKPIFDATRQLCSKPTRRTDSVRSKEGILLTKEEEVRKRWKEHFAEVLNRPPPYGRNWRVIKLVNHPKLKQVLLHMQRSRQL